MSPLQRETCLSLTTRSVVLFVHVLEPRGPERGRGGGTASSLCLKLGQFEPWAAGRDGWVSGGWLGWQKLPKPACRCLFQPEACPLLVLIPFSHSSFLSSSPVTCTDRGRCFASGRALMHPTNSCRPIVSNSSRGPGPTCQIVSNSPRAPGPTCQIASNFPPAPPTVGTDFEGPAGCEALMPSERNLDAAVWNLDTRGPPGAGNLTRSEGNR